MPPFPKVVRIEPASACTLRCSHCPTGTVNMKRGLMSEESFNLIINQLLEHDISVSTFVLYHGGEPFLNPNFFKFLEIIKTHWPFSFVKTVSNGSLFSKSLIDAIVNSRLDQLQISIDSSSPENSDFHRRGSDTEKLISNVNSLVLAVKKSNSPLSIEISTTQFFKSTDMYKDPYSAKPDASWIKHHVDYDLPIVGAWAMKWPRMNLPSIYTAKTYIDPTMNEAFDSSCDHVSNTITVRSDGTVVPCCYDLLSDLNMGNIYSKSILSIWESQPYFDLREDIGNANPCSTCKECNVIRKDKVFLEWNDVTVKNQVIEVSQS